jgi:hypothetical protein
LEPLRLFEDMDRQLGVVLTQFENLADQIELQEVCALSDMETIEKQAYPGIYMVSMKTDSRSGSIEKWLSQFTREWDNPAFVGNYTPTTKLRRMAQHTVLNEWVHCGDAL